MVFMGRVPLWRGKCRQHSNPNNPLDRRAHRLQAELWKPSLHSGPANGLRQVPPPLWISFHRLYEALTSKGPLSVGSEIGQPDA